MKNFLILNLLVRTIIPGPKSVEKNKEKDWEKSLIMSLMLYVLRQLYLGYKIKK